MSPAALQRTATTITSVPTIAVIRSAISTTAMMVHTVTSSMQLPAPVALGSRPATVRVPLRTCSQLWRGTALGRSRLVEVIPLQLLSQVHQPRVASPCSA